MPRYIDADAFFADFPELRDYEYASQEYEADVVEVVRCKDCKYGVDWDGRLGCEWHGFYQTEPNWFCADGERRDDDG